MSPDPLPRLREFAGEHIYLLDADDRRYEGRLVALTDQWGIPAPVLRIGEETVVPFPVALHAIHEVGLSNQGRDEAGLPHTSTPGHLVLAG